MFTSFICQQVCSLRLSPTEWKLYFLKYLGLKTIKISLLAFKKSVFSKRSVGRRYKLVQLFRITLWLVVNVWRKPLTRLRAEPCTKLLLAKPTDGSWCDATLQSSIMCFMKFICQNSFGGLMLRKQLTLFLSKRTNSFCIYASLNRSSTRPNVSQFVTICMSLRIIKCFLINF